MKVLVACEFSGTVRDAFKALGHHAVSCDLLPTETPGWHHEGDVRDILRQSWDLMIAHPPCTDLAVSGAAWFKEKIADGRQQRALDFVQMLMDAPIPRICIENPISVISSKIRKPDQIIQPWMFGHLETKATCLWLKGLPKLIPTTDLKEETMKLPERDRMRLHYLPPGPNRWKERSKTFHGIAYAMASQWSNLNESKHE
jgi:site-specific DNA-cytosine methylase